MVCLCLLTGCPGKPSKEVPVAATPVRLPVGQIPNFVDDLDIGSLQTAVKQSLRFYDRVPADRTYRFGDLQIRADVLRSTLVEFLDLINSGRLNAATISRTFDVYQFQQGTDPAEVLLTGYYEPILKAQLQPSGEYRYPLYSKPADVLTIDLAAFNSELYAGKSLKGRLAGNRVVPYYTREEIDNQGKLRGCGCELAWLKDPLDAFFLHVQGSGMLQLPGGKLVRIGYASSNGRPYRSIGRYMIDKGWMTREEMSLQAIRSYLRAHHEVEHEVLWYNESYVFFRWVDEGPLGSLNVPLTGGRSIATDPGFYPRGGIAFLQSQRPHLNANGQVSHWEPLHRWVLNQDTGGAIKGAKRADLFCGSGEPAEQVAGRLKHPARLYFLLKKSP